MDCLEYSANQSNIVIENLTIENQNSGGCIGIDFSQNVSKVTVQGNTFYGPHEQSVNINSTGVSHINVIGNHFEEVAWGVLTNFLATDLYDVRVIDNQFIHIYADAIELNHPGTAYEAGKEFIISGNYMHVPSGYGSGATAGFGIGVAGATNVTISNNIMDDCRYEAIHIEDEAKHISIVGNIINGVGKDANNSPDCLNTGIYVIDGDFITVTGNSISNAHDYGIHLNMAANNDASEVVVTGNTVTKCGNTSNPAEGGGIKIDSFDMEIDVIISNNVITENTGNGIELANNLANLKLTNNISRGNSGYGLYISGRQGYNWYISGNSLSGNTAGDMGFAANIASPVPVRNSNAYFTETATSNYTPWHNAIKLGKGAKGLLYVTATKDGGFYCTAIYDITWDGKTLTKTTIAIDGYGTLGLNDPQMSGDYLQVSAYNPSNSLVTFDVQFEGLSMVK